MSYSNDFIVNVNSLHSDDPVLVLMDISHPFLSETVRLINDNQNMISEGNDYIAMPFEIKRQSDTQNELPKIILNIQNVGRSLDTGPFLLISSITIVRT